MGGVGLLLLALALALMLSTGWPTYAVLLGVGTLGALLGLALGAFDPSLLGSLPGRVVGLLEHDLLQALALYSLVGALLQRLSIAGHLQAGLERLFARPFGGAAPPLATLVLGALLSPLNGSVGASVLTLARDAPAAAVGPRRAALVAVAGTLGVIVPPSIVLLLLGDAMLRAHTEGLNLARDLALPLASAGTRIVNTQDVLQAALVPGVLVLAGWFALTAWRGRSMPAPPTTAWTRGDALAVLVVPSLIALLLVGVASGRVRAVEAAATAGVALVLYGVITRQLRARVLRQVLDDALVLTGALFALLVAATTFSLLLRAFGTDRWVADAMAALQGHPSWALAAVMAVLFGCAFVLDAFELIFLVVPIVMPPLLAQVGDAAWVAVLTLLVLQAGFLLPPAGYAVMLARSRFTPRPPLGPMARALAPYVAWVLLVAGAVAVAPQVTRWARTAPPDIAPANGNADDVERLMREMSAPRVP